MQKHLKVKLILLKLLGEYVTENYSRSLSFYDLKINIMLNFCRKKECLWLFRV